MVQRRVAVLRRRRRTLALLTPGPRPVWARVWLRHCCIYKVCILPVSFQSLKTIISESSPTVQSHSPVPSPVHRIETACIYWFLHLLILTWRPHASSVGEAPSSTFDWALVRMLCLLEGQLFCTETTLQPLLKRRKQKEYSSVTQLKLILAY